MAIIDPKPVFGKASGVVVLREKDLSDSELVTAVVVEELGQDSVRGKISAP